MGDCVVGLKQKTLDQSSFRDLLVICLISSSEPEGNLFTQYSTIDTLPAKTAASNSETFVVVRFRNGASFAAKYSMVLLSISPCRPAAASFLFRSKMAPFHEVNSIEQLLASLNASRGKEQKLQQAVEGAVSPSSQWVFLLNCL